MTNSRKGFVFFYDWEQSFAALKGDDCKALILAMVKYSRDDVEPPKFEGIPAIAASFLFPALTRSKENVVRGSKGGIASAEKKRRSGKSVCDIAESTSGGISVGASGGITVSASGGITVSASGGISESTSGGISVSASGGITDGSSGGSTTGSEAFQPQDETKQDETKQDKTKQDVTETELLSRPRADSEEDRPAVETERRAAETLSDHTDEERERIERANENARKIKEGHERFRLSYPNMENQLAALRLWYEHQWREGEMDEIMEAAKCFDYKNAPPADDFLRGCFGVLKN